MPSSKFQKIDKITLHIRKQPNNSPSPIKCGIKFRLCQMQYEIPSLSDVKSASPN